MSSLSRRALGVIAGVCLCVLFLSISFTLASPEDSPSEHSGLWGAFPQLMVEVSPLLGEVRAVDDEVGYVHRLTVDPDQRHVWTLHWVSDSSSEANAPAALSRDIPKLDAESAELAEQIAAEQQAVSGADSDSPAWAGRASWQLRVRHVNHEPVRSFPLTGAWGPTVQALHVDSENDTLWVVGLLHVFRYSLDGEHLDTLPTGQLIRDSSLDRSQGRLLLALGRELAAFDSGGEQTLSIDLHPRNQAVLVAHDAKRKLIRTVAGDELRSYDAHGNLVASTGDNWFRRARHLETDADGGVWLADNQWLRRYDADDVRTVNIRPFAGPLGGRIDQLTINQMHEQVWVASRNTLHAYDREGQQIHSLSVDNGWFGPGRFQNLSAYWDQYQPELDIHQPADGSFTNNPRPLFELEYGNTPDDVDPDSLEFLVDGEEIQMDCDADGSQASCTPTFDLEDGEYRFSITIANAAGTRSEAVDVSFTMDTIPPEITVTSPEDGSWTNQPLATIGGSVNEPASLTINGSSIELDDAFAFHTELNLEEGENPITLRATDRAGNVTEKTRLVILDTIPPDPIDPGLIVISDPDEDGNVTVEGGPGSAEPGATVEVTNTRTGATVQAQVNADGSFSTTLPGQAGDSYEIVVRDRAGNESDTVVVEGAGGDGVPPNPNLIAPELPVSGVLSFGDGISFLYEGANPVQFDVAADYIDSDRVAVLRGVVRDESQNPISGVQVSVLGEPGFGYTKSRQDGKYDLVVNAGRTVVLAFQSEDHLPVQREIAPQPGDWFYVGDVNLTALDHKVTTIDLVNMDEPFQIARGGLVSDADGERQATLLFPAGTQAEWVKPDGTREFLNEIDVRATEYTVGAAGPDAMPAMLPSNTAYTYAVELTIDQVLEESSYPNRGSVSFDRPVPFYLENFLDFPVGGSAPVGYYDHSQARWIGYPDGVVLEILDVHDGVAQVDLVGGGSAASLDEMEQHGISLDELESLGSLYEIGDRLWRVPVEHFSTWDINWPWGPSWDAEEPELGVDRNENEDIDSAEEDCVPGCVINPQRGALGKSLDIPGTPFSLHYHSDRSPGYKKGTFELTLSGDSVPDGLKYIEVNITIAGQSVTERFSPESNLKYQFSWDGHDVYGRPYRQSADARVRLSHVYECVYLQPQERERSFGLFGDTTRPIGTMERCQGFEFSDSQKITLRSPLAPEGLAGNWTLSDEIFAPGEEGMMLTGDGRQYRVGIDDLIKTVAGTGVQGYTGDGGPATEARLNHPNNVSFGPDGNLYIAGYQNGVIRRVNSDGVIETVPGSEGVQTPAAVAFDRAGHMYVADTLGNQIIRISSDAEITVIAGTGERGFSGDGGLATDADLNWPSDIAVARDGGIYFSSAQNNRIRYIDGRGIIDTVVGNGEASFNGDGIPPHEASVSPNAIALDIDGRLYFTDGASARVRMVGADGLVRTVAGNGDWFHSGDGGMATDASFSSVSDVAVDHSGNVYVVDYWENRVRVIDGRGVIRTLAGNGRWGDEGDGGPASEAELKWPYGADVSPDGNLYIADTWNEKIRKVRINQGVTSGGHGGLASNDGSKVFLFDENGQHVETIETLLGHSIYTFDRDGEGRIVEIRDRFDNVVSVQRDQSGLPVSITADGGQVTHLTFDSEGRLISVTDPTDEEWSMTYHAGGLLASFVDRAGAVSHYEYDSEGRLSIDRNSIGGGWVLDRSSSDEGERVTMLSAMARKLSFVSSKSDDKGRLYIRTDEGVGSTRREHKPRSRTIESPNGVMVEEYLSPDPRFGMRSPYVSERRVVLPSGLERIITTDRFVEAGNTLYTPEVIREESLVNGRRYTRKYSAHDKAQRTESPMGRRSEARFDEVGLLLSYSRPNGSELEYSYDDKGRVENYTHRSDGLERVHSVEWASEGEGRGYVSAFVDPIGRRSEMQFDANGNLLEEVLPGLRTTRYGYDSEGRMVELVTPLGDRHVFDYDSAGNETGYTPPELDESDWHTRYSYDLDQNLENIARPDGMIIDLSYDSAGRVESVLSAGQEFRYEYADGMRAPSLISLSTGVSLAFEYDGNLPSSETWSGGVIGEVAYSWDNNFWLRELAVDNYTVSYDYDSDGLMIAAGDLSIQRDEESGLPGTVHLGNSTEHWYFGAFSELESLESEVAGESIHSVSYERDAIGRITQKTETIDGETIAWVYDYDQAGHLKTVTRNGQAHASYDYDANGNRLTRSTPSGTETGTYDDQDRLLTYAGRSYEYSRNGDLEAWSEDGVRTEFDYDAFGNLRHVSLPGDVEIDYLIDGRNRRVGKQVNGELVQGFLYQDQLNPVAELDGDGNVVSRFIYATRPNVPDYMLRNGERYRFITDHLGSVRLVVNADTGDIAQRMDYDEFGRVLNDSNPGFQPFGFAGGIYDQHTGLVRFGARDYDPTAGRWTAKDPIRFDGDGPNLYGYVLGDPVNFYDPLGLWRWGDPLPQWMVDGAAGFGDGISGGLTHRARDYLGTNHVVDQNSRAYGRSRTAGTATGMAGGVGSVAAGSRIGSAMFSGLDMASTITDIRLDCDPTAAWVDAGGLALQQLIAGRINGGSAVDARIAAAVATGYIDGMRQFIGANIGGGR